MAPEKRPVRLALIQFESTLCDTHANVKKACRFIAEAGQQKADLVVLPELFSTGYELSIVGPKLPDLVESIEGPTTTALCKAARDAHTNVIAGIALTHEIPNVPYNSSVIINRDGQLLGTYDKQHLWAGERAYFRSGSETPVWHLDFGNVGVMICYDMGFPEVARMLALQGAELIVCPSAWCEEDEDVWDANVRCRALEETVFLAAVNRYGHEGDSLYMGGHTLACNPRGHVVAEIKEETEGVLYVDIDLSDLAKARVTSPYLRDRRPDIYKKVLLP